MSGHGDSGHGSADEPTDGASDAGGGEHGSDHASPDATAVRGLSLEQDGYRLGEVQAPDVG